MFCPECKSEFIDGIKKCPECMVGLIEKLPPEQKPPKPEFVDYEEILSNLNHADIAILKLFLDREKITYFFEGENFHISFATPKLMVRTDQVGIANELIKDLKLSCMGAKIDKGTKSE
jgi:hypothetical protein